MVAPTDLSAVFLPYLNDENSFMLRRFFRKNSFTDLTNCKFSDENIKNLLYICKKRLQKTQQFVILL